MSVRYRKDRKKWERSVGSGPERKRLLFETKAEALKYQPETVIEPVTGSASDFITIDEAIKTYYGKVSFSKSKTSRKGERLYLNLMHYNLTELQRLMNLDQVRYGHMFALQKWMQEPMHFDGKVYVWAPATVNRAFNSIKDFFVYWVRDERILASPCAHLEQLEHEDNSRRPMTFDEFQLAYAKAREWFRPAMLFTYLTASAPSTLARLKWSDVDFARKSLTLTRRKGAKGRFRRISHPMTEAVHELLSTQPRRHDYVFSNESGKPLSADWCSDVGNEAIKAAGLSDVVLYCMRHSLASDLTDANVNLEVIRQLMGHSNIRTTQRYAKPSQETLANAVRMVRGSELPPDCHHDERDRRALVAGDNK